MSKVAVIMSTYNGGHYLREQIDSILSQRGCEVSLWVRDDGSSDNTMDILHDYENAGKLKCIQGKNLKPALSFLTALQLSEDADFYAFSDQDDIWDNEKLKTAIQFLRQEKMSTPNLYCCNLTPIDARGAVIQEKLLPEKIITDYKEVLIRSPYIYGCTMVFNRTMRDYVVQRPLPQYALMHDMWIILIAAVFGTIVYDSNSYIRYRQHDNNCIGASIGPKEKWKKRIQVLTQKPSVSRADQAMEFISYVGKEELKSRDLYAYTEMVANYRNSLKAKWDYAIKIEHSSMNVRQYMFHFLTVLLNRL